MSATRIYVPLARFLDDQDAIRNWFIDHARAQVDWSDLYDDDPSRPLQPYLIIATDADSTPNLEWWDHMVRNEIAVLRPDDMLFEFDNARVAMLFKLTFGGS